MIYLVEPLLRTPIVTSNSVVALYYNNGVMLAVDSGLGYYGILDGKNKQEDRIFKINSQTVLGKPLLLSL